MELKFFFIIFGEVGNYLPERPFPRLCPSSGRWRMEKYNLPTSVVSSNTYSECFEPQVVSCKHPILHHSTPKDHSTTSVLACF